MKRRGKFKGHTPFMSQFASEFRMWPVSLLPVRRPRAWPLRRMMAQRDLLRAIERAKD